MIAYGDFVDGSGLETDETSFTVTYGSGISGNIVVPANSTITISGSKIGTLLDFDTRGGTLLFRNSNSAYNVTGAIEQ